MAQIKIKSFDFLPDNNVFYNNAGRRLYVEFELFFAKSEVNYDKEYEVVFSINSMTNSCREFKANAGSKLIRILNDENNIPQGHDYTITANGNLHVLNSFISNQIEEQILTDKNHDSVFYELFITAELFSTNDHDSIGFSESSCKSLFISKQAS